MFVVKRPFRNYGKVYTAGTVITDPAAIKRFNGKLAEGKIMEVTEQTFESTAKYFKEKFGVDITPASEPTEPEPTEPEPTAVEEVKATQKVVVTTVK